MKKTAETTEQYRVFVVPHTHWDREWYLTFQQFRVRLINLIDHLLEILEKDENFSNFNFDGQTVVLEDYLEIHPEKRGLLKEYIKANRIQVGPWYILPDEFLVSAEATVRNLLLGHRIAEEFGRVMKVGYLPDPFGHISQMPQILLGFGIDNIIFWRGIEYQKSRGGEFIWQGADGSEILAVHLPAVGYCNARSLSEDEDRAFEQIRAATTDLRQRETSKGLLLLNGVDHLEAQEHIPVLIKALNTRFTDLELVLGNLEEYIKYARKTQSREYRRLQGEFRSSRDMMVLNGVYSSRMYLKQENDNCQVLLEGWAEPTSTMAALLGKRYRRNLLWQSWRWLMKNHPHDSICGCSIDQVHREMITRFDWSRQIAGEIIAENLAYISSKIRVEGLDEDELALAVFNPLPYRREENIQVRMEFGGAVSLNRIKVFNMDGDEIPSQLKKRGKARKMVLDESDTPRFVEINYADISFTAGNIPSMGFQTYRIKASAARKMPREYKTDIASGPDYIENQYFKITADAKGTVNIYDKLNQLTFRNCNRFVDSGDAGDEYTYSPPLEDRIIVGKPDQICVEGTGPAEITLGLSGEMVIPESLASDRQSRKAKTVGCPLETTITLYSNLQRIDFKTKFVNLARDHRLRVEFPTGFDTRYVYADGHFNVVRRKIEIPDSEGWVEKAYQTAHNSGFVLLNDGKSGLALLNRGLPEYEIIMEDSTIALTLLRAVGWLSVEELEYRLREAGPCLPTPEAQCPGEHIFAYSLIPHQGSWEAAQLSRLTKQYKTGIRTRQLGNQRGSIPGEFSLLQLEGQLEFSAFKKHEREEKYLIRVYNPTGKKVSGELKLNMTGRAYLGNLNEDYQEEIDFKGGRVKLSLGPGEVKTVILEVDNGFSR